MMRAMRTHFAFMLAACCWLVLLALPCRAQNAEVFRGVDFEQHLDRPLPLDAGFRDEEGRAVRLGQYFGGPPVVLVLGYVRCPNLCGTTFIGVNESLHNGGLRPDIDYRPVFVSIDPGEAHQDGIFQQPDAELKKWHFLRGDEQSIRRVADAAGFRYAYDPGMKQYAHPAGFVVATPEGAISRYFFGVRFSPAMLRLALADASHGKSGSLADRLLLLCYHYDPQAGRYNLAIMNGLRVLAAAFALGVVFAIRHRTKRGAR